MIFAGMQDSHDRRAEKLSEHEDTTAADLTHMNLVGIRRRLNNIEAGVWALVALVALDIFLLR
ncbi:MAG: hypothetical protein IBJ07_12200 [Rhizobiaceae bacterium]|nr:hypothetical protein [Rhizobiaceae bacterium]